MLVNTKILTTILLVAVISTFVKAFSPERVECPEICPALYQPVCAFNGKKYAEFGNHCILQTSNCRVQSNEISLYEEVDSAWCHTKPVENISTIMGYLDTDLPQCMRPCTMIYAPLCVTNGIYRTTVSSQCILDMYNCALAENHEENLFRQLRDGHC